MDQNVIDKELLLRDIRSRINKVEIEQLKIETKLVVLREIATAIEINKL